MFTKIANGILWFGVVAGFILSIAIGVVVGKQESGGFGFLIGFGGCIATLIVFTGFGMIVEMANNIETSRKCLERLCNPSYSVGGGVPNGAVSYASTGAASYVSTGAASGVSTTASAKNDEPYDILRLAAEQREEKKNTWFCPSCRTENNENSMYCIKCHTQKPGSVGHWFCSCGQKNGGDQSYCSKCGTPRYGDKPAQPASGNSWRCSTCGEMNDEFAYSCKKCGGSKY